MKKTAKVGSEAAKRSARAASRKTRANKVAHATLKGLARAGAKKTRAQKLAHATPKVSTPASSRVQKVAKKPSIARPRTQQVMERLLQESDARNAKLETRHTEACRVHGETGTALREAEERFSRSVDAAQTGCFRVDRKGRFEQVNDAWLRMHGYSSAEEVIGQPFSLTQTEEDVKRARQLVMRLLRGKAIPSGEFTRRNKDGSVGHHVFSAWPVRSRGKIVGLEGFLIDTSEHAAAEEGNRLALEVLHLLNSTTDLHTLMSQVTVYLGEHFGCEAVGIRLKEGEDYPYFETRGFPPEFVQAENRLCAVDEKNEVIRDSAGHPVLECMCGNIICGRFDPSKPFFTQQGSFWTNCTSELLATTTEAERQARTRNRCNGEGYESVALIRLQAGGVPLGLVQLNDRRRGRFTPRKIVLLERIASKIAIGLAQRKAEKALLDKTLELDTVFHALPDLYFRVRLDGTIVDYRGGRADDLHVPPEAFIGHRMQSVLPSAVGELFEKAFGEAEASGHPVAFEYPLSVPSGDKVFEARLQRLDKDELVVVARDITQRKQAEEAIRKSEAKYRHLYESMTDAFSRTDMAGQLVEFNTLYREMLGYSEEELHRLTYVDLTPERWHAFEKQIIEEQVIAHGYSEVYEKEYRRKDGSVFPVELRTYLIRDDGGQAVGMWAIVRDITERKATQELMDRSRAELKAIYESAPVMMCVLDEQRNVLYANRAFAEFAGRSEDELKSSRACGVLGCVNALDDPRGCGFGRECESCSLRLALEDTLRTGRKHRDVEHETTLQVDGRRREAVFLASTALIQVAGKADLLLCLEDITDRKWAERQNEALGRMATRLAAALDIDGMVDAVEEATQQLLFWDAHFFAVRRPSSDAFHVLRFVDTISGEKKVFSPESWESTDLSEPLQPLVRGEAVLINRETNTSEPVFECFGDEECPSASLMYVPVRSGSGVIGILSAQSYTPLRYDEADLHLLQRVADIVAPALDRVCAEEALKKSEEKFSKAFLVSPAPISVTRLSDGRLVEVNEAFEDLTGYRRDEMVGRTAVELGVWVDLKEREHALQVLEAEGHVRDMECRYRAKDGHLIICRYSAEIIELGGEPCGLVTLMDITARRQVEEALRREQEFAHALLENVVDGVVACDTDGELVLFNRTAREWHGTDPTGIPQTEWAAHYDLYCPDGATLLPTEALPLVRALRGEVVRDAAMTIRAKGQPLRHVIANGAPFLDEAGRKLGSVVVMRDVTAALEAQQALRESEERYRTLFEHMREGLAYCQVLYDEQGRPEDWVYLEVNDAFTRLTGLTDVVGKRVTEVLPGIREASPTVFDVYDRVASSGRPEQFDLDFKPLGMWLSISAFSPAKGYFVAVFQDISERKRAEAALQASEQKFRTLFDTMVEGVALHEIIRDGSGKSVDYRIIDINPAYEKQTGLPASKARGKLASELYGSDSPPYIDIYSAVEETGEPHEMEVFFRPLQRHFRISVFTPGRGLFATVFEDMTESIRAEDERLRLEEQLRQVQKLEAIGQLAAGVAHDFNNLLSVIRGQTSQITAAGSEDAAIHEPLAMIEQAVEQAGEITRSLLTFSRVMPSEKKRLQLCGVVREAERLLRHVLPARVRLETVLSEGCDCWVKADQTQLHQMILNLAINARDAMSGGGTLTIAVCGAEHVSDSQGKDAVCYPCDLVRLVVTDTGIGIPPAVRSRIFEPFFTTKPRGEGTGLGLSIVHGIVTDHDGEIEVESQVNVGTTFTIMLPCSPPPAEGESELEVSAGVRGQGELIVLADSDLFMRGAIASFLESSGYRVLLAANEEAVLELVAGHQSETRLVILGNALPGSGAYQCLDAIRGIAGGLPAIVLADAGEAAREGTDDLTTIVLEPFSMSELARIVSYALTEGGRGEVRA